MADEPKPPTDKPPLEPWMGGPKPPPAPPEPPPPFPLPEGPAIELVPVKVAPSTPEPPAKPAPLPMEWPWASEPPPAETAPPAPVEAAPPAPTPAPEPTEWPWPSRTERTPAVHYAASSDGLDPPPPPEPHPVGPTAEDEIDADHFAIAEVDYHDNTWLDRGFGWLARMLGVRSDETEGGDAAVGRARGWATRTIIFAALTLLVINAASLKSWASTLPPNWGSSTLRLIAGEWADRLQAAGLDEPRRRIHAAYETEKTLTWKGKVTPPPK